MNREGHVYSYEKEGEVHVNYTVGGQGAYKHKVTQLRGICCPTAEDSVVHPLCQFEVAFDATDLPAFLIYAAYCINPKFIVPKSVGMSPTNVVINQAVSMIPAQKFDSVISVVVQQKQYNMANTRDHYTNNLKINHKLLIRMSISQGTYLNTLNFYNETTPIIPQLIKDALEITLTMLDVGPSLQQGFKYLSENAQLTQSARHKFMTLYDLLMNVCNQNTYSGNNLLTNEILNNVSWRYVFINLFLVLDIVLQHTRFH